MSVELFKFSGNHILSIPTVTVKHTSYYIGSSSNLGIVKYEV